jgi:hypothetical protein
VDSLYMVLGRKLRERGQSGWRNMVNSIGTYRQPSSRLQRGGQGKERSKRGTAPFQGPPEGITFLLTAWFHSLRPQMRGFHDLLREKLSSLLMLRQSSIPIASLVIQSMCLNFLARILVLCSWILQPRIMLCSATTDISWWHIQMCQWCSSTLVSIKHPVRPMYTFPHSQGMLYMPGIFRVRSSLMNRRKLHSFLGRRSTVYMAALKG